MEKENAILSEEIFYNEARRVFMPLTKLLVRHHLKFWISWGAKVGVFF